MTQIFHTGHAITTTPKCSWRPGTLPSKDVGCQACTHTIDRGTDGLLRTPEALDAAGLKHTGSCRTENESHGILITREP